MADQLERARIEEGLLQHPTDKVLDEADVALLFMSYHSSQRGDFGH